MRDGEIEGGGNREKSRCGTFETFGTLALGLWFLLIVEVF